MKTLHKIESLRLKGLIKEVSYLAGAFDLADYVPLLGALYLQALFFWKEDLLVLN